MEFDQFLEKDILSFLDGKIEHKHKGAVDREEEYGLYLTKDYMKELTSSLDNDELTKAKKLFDELKQTYNNLPKNSLERKKIYTLLEQMYAKIEAYVQMRTRSGSGTSIPLVISQVVESKDKGHVNTLDMQSSILENQLEGLDKKFSATENEVSVLKTELAGHDFNAGGFTEQKSEKNDLDKFSSDPFKQPLPVITTPDIGESKVKKSDVHNDKSIEIFKIPKKTAKEDSKYVEKIHQEKKILDKSKDAAEALYNIQENNIQEKTPYNDATTSELIERMPLPNTKIESYMVAKEQKPEKVPNKKSEKVSDNPLISAEDEARYLEGFEHVEKMYFEGIYLFYNHNYQDASKLFEQVLSARPKSKAAKIRLQECMEAIESG
jgi:tetratricopeptide (TPR) repeat protein